MGRPGEPLQVRQANAAPVWVERRLGLADQPASPMQGANVPAAWLHPGVRSTWVRRRVLPRR